MSAELLSAFTPYLTLSVVLSAVGGFCGAYFTSYLRKKGEDRAVRESLDEFTRIAEGIKHDYTMLTEQFRADQSHRFLVAEKRFDALQQAFVQWRVVFDAIGDRATFDVAVEKAKQWWNENCLYLDPKARQAFNRGMVAVLQWAGHRIPDEEHERQWNVFFWDTPEAIFEAAKMPPLAKDELPAEPETFEGPAFTSDEQMDQ